MSKVFEIWHFWNIEICENTCHGQSEFIGGDDILSWSQKNSIHGINVAAPAVTKKSPCQVRRIIYQHLAVKQISCLVQSLLLMFWIHVK